MIPVPTSDSMSATRPSVGGSPFGIAWAFLYGYSGVPAAKYLPVLRTLGADFTKVYLFWQQIEPEKGNFDWAAVDAFADQLNAPEEGLISLFSASRWATKTPAALLPPSPAINLDDYYRFVFETVKRCRGRVRYWQNDCEPNNPVFWSGTKEEFVTQLKVFHRAVKSADPNAVVVVGGYDGLFVPPGMKVPPGQRAAFPGQAVGLEFFDYVLREGRGAFDCFDLRLYADPYTIVPRVDYIRSRMHAFDNILPILCTEYGGPNLFEFPPNRQYTSFVSLWAQTTTTLDAHGLPAGVAAASNPIAGLYANMSALAPETQMFMQGCPPELEARYHRIQARSLVMRNILALSAGVERLLYWQLVSIPGAREDLMNLMYGKIGLLAVEDGELKRRTPSAEAYARMTQSLAGVERVTRIALPEQPTVHLFAVDRGARGKMYVGWEQRDAFGGEDQPPVHCTFATELTSARALDVFGHSVPLQCEGGCIRITFTVTPVYVEPPDRLVCHE